MQTGVEEYRGWLRLDPRTKLMYTFTVGLFCLVLIGGDSETADVIRLALSISVGLLLLGTRQVMAALLYAGVVTGCSLLASLVLPMIDGGVQWLLYASISIITQVLPGAMAAYWMLATTTASELVAALQRIHIPQVVTVPLAVMFRYFPTAIAEQRAINDSMRMRGVRFGGGKISELFEYRVVPLMTNSVRIADELSQAALTRGLGAEKRRTSIARIGFHAVDVVVLAACLACYVLLVMANANLLP